MAKASASSVRGSRAASKGRRTVRPIDFSDIPELTPAQRNQVKQVARDLLGKLHTSLRIDWHKTAQSRAVVLDAIEETLDEGLPEPYTPELFRAKSGMIFQHVYERYGA